MKQRQRIIALGITLVAATIIAPRAALADEPAPAAPPAVPGVEATPDAVHLRNGGMLRGRVTEIVPGDHVTVLLVGGEQKRIVWAEVDRVVVATPPGTSSTPQPPGPGTAPATNANAPMVGPKVRVRLKGSGTLYLYRRPAGSSESVQACESPCDIDLPIGDTYKVGGSGVTTTKEFRIDAVPAGKYVEITVDGPSWLGIIGGGLIAIVGGLTAYVGLVFTVAGGSSGSSSTSRDIRNIGIGALLVGGGLIALGILIVLPSMKTDLSQETKAPSKDGFLRTPTWKTIASSSSESGLPTATFPIVFQHAF